VAEGDRREKILTPREVTDKAAFALALDACGDDDEARGTIEEMILESGVEVTADDRAWVGYRERMVAAIVEYMCTRWSSTAD
jgi:hypothetical protein